MRASTTAPLPPGCLENAVRRVRGFLGLERSIVGLLVMVILIGMGEHIAERFLPVYLLALGGGSLSIGFLNGLDNLLSALYSYPGGYLADRLGHKRALLLFNVFAMVGFLIVILIPAWQAVIIGSFFFLSWSAISMPATMSIVFRALPGDKRTMGVSVHSLVRRVPIAIGPLLGGLCISAWGERAGVRIAFVGAFVLACAAAIAQQALIEENPHRDAQAFRAPKNPIALLRHMSPSLKRLLVSDILVRFCEQIPHAFVVIWCMKTIPAPVSAVQFGLLTTIEMATAVLIYVPVAWCADRGTKKPFVLITFVLFSLFPLVLFYCRSLPLLVLAFVLRGLKEFGEPTRKALIMELAPNDCKAGMFGLYYLMRDVVVSIASFGGAFLWQASPQLNLMTAFVFGVLGTVWFAVYGSDHDNERKEAQQNVAPLT